MLRLSQLVKRRLALTPLPSLNALPFTQFSDNKDKTKKKKFFKAFSKTQDQKLIDGLKSGKFKIFKEPAKPLKHLEREQDINRKETKIQRQFYPEKEHQSQIEPKQPLVQNVGFNVSEEPPNIPDPDTPPTLDETQELETPSQSKLDQMLLAKKKLYGSIQAVGTTVEEQTAKLALGIKQSAQKIEDIKSKSQIVAEFQNLLDYEFISDSNVKNPDFPRLIQHYIEKQGLDKKLISHLSKKVTKEAMEIKKLRPLLHRRIESTFQLFQSHSELNLVLLNFYVSDRCKFSEPGSLLSDFLILLTQLGSAEILPEVQQKAIALLKEKEIKQDLVVKLSSDPQQSIKLYFADMIRSSNQFQGLLSLMRFSAGQISKLKGKVPQIEELAWRLEWLLNSKVSFQKEDVYQREDVDYSVPGAIATSPSFEYGSALKKMKIIQDHHSQKQKLRQLDRIISEVEEFLQTGQGDTMTATRFEQLRVFMRVNQYGNQALNDKAKKVNLITNSLLTEHVKRNFNLKQSVSFENLFRIFDPEVSGNWDLVNRRNYLINQGMKSSLADSLALKFIENTFERSFNFIELLENKTSIDPRRMRVDFLSKKDYIRSLERYYEKKQSKTTEQKGAIQTGALKESKTNLKRQNRGSQVW